MARLSRMDEALAVSAQHETTLLHDMKRERTQHAKEVSTHRAINAIQRQHTRQSHAVERLGTPLVELQGAVQCLRAT